MSALKIQLLGHVQAELNGQPLTWHQGGEGAPKRKLVVKVLKLN